MVSAVSLNGRSHVLSVLWQKHEPFDAVCSSCGRCLKFVNGAEQMEGPNAPRTSNVKQPDNAKPTENPCPSYKQVLEYRSAKDSKRVQINIGLMVPHATDGTDLKPLRGKTLPLFVDPEAAAPDVLKEAVQRMRTFYKDMPEALYVLLYPDCSEVVRVPRSGRPFKLSEYKKELGKPYSRINFYLCLETHFKGAADATSDSGCDSEIVIASRSQVEFNQADTVVSTSGQLAGVHDVVCKTKPTTSSTDTQDVVIKIEPTTSSTDTHDVVIKIEPITSSTDTDDVVIKIGPTTSSTDTHDVVIKIESTSSTDTHDVVCKTEPTTSSTDTPHPEVSTNGPANSVTASTESANVTMASPRPVQKTAAYVVYEECLLKLFELCPVCQRVTNVQTGRLGLMLSVVQRCPHCQFFRKWNSQPDLGSTVSTVSKEPCSALSHEAPKTGPPKMESVCTQLSNEPCSAISHKAPKTGPPKMKSVATQLSKRTLQSHIRSKATQVTVPTRDCGVSTVTFPLNSPLLLLQPTTVRRPSKRPRLSITEEEPSERGSSKVHKPEIQPDSVDCENLARQQALSGSIGTV